MSASDANPVLASRQANRDDSSLVNCAGIQIGDGFFTIIAGPCAVESREQLLTSAHGVARAGAAMLRGGAYKPRTSPYSFQGLGVDGLALLAEARDATGLPIVTELLDVRDLDDVLAVADLVQIGARNMHNAALLREVGRARTPVLLKRGPAATLDELLLAAEYVLCEGNTQVVLCERGIRTFEHAYRFTLDVAAVPVLKQRTHLPVIVDPSHAAGSAMLVEPLALAATAAGADGLLVEAHCAPHGAQCDGAQALSIDRLQVLVERVSDIARMHGRQLHGPRCPPRERDATLALASGPI